MTTEHRAAAAPPERADAHTIHGVAIRAGETTRIRDVFGEEFDEQFARGAFEPEDDMMLLVGHDQRGIPLARRANGTLVVDAKPTALTYEARLRPGATADDLLAAIERRDVGGSSIGFEVLDQVWDAKATPPLRTITRARIVEVSLVAQPAYAGATVGRRDLGCPDPANPTLERIRSILS